MVKEKSVKEVFELRKVQQVMHGDSLSMIIPMKFVKILGIEKQDYLKMKLDGKRIIVEKGF